MIKPATAEKILSDVCGKHIPGRFFVEHETSPDGEPVILVVSKDSGNAFAWGLSFPDLTEKLLHLDAHSFCAWVIREEGDVEGQGKFTVVSVKSRKRSR